LEPGFRPADSPARVVGRLPTTGDPRIEAAVDRALAEAELDVVRLDWNELETGSNCFTTLYFNEIWDVDHALVEARPADVGEDIHSVLGMVDVFRPGMATVMDELDTWRKSLLSLFERVELLALPTIPVFPPRIDEVSPDTMLQVVIDITRHVSLFNAAGTPCTAQPVPVPGAQLPASLQLVGPLGGEELLLASAAVIETAVG
ncbi:MAG TPA: amidase family protein, partial [Acidimicrobiales bacterium]|nr:amidase family protein [Acidimicrobiales bacterium]